jgi:hypothetical protein
MTLSIDELEQRCELLQAAFETITAIDEVRAGKQPVTASTAPRGTPGASQIERMAAIRPGQPSPTATTHFGAVSRPTIVAAAAGAGMFPGQPLENPAQLAGLIHDTYRTLGPGLPPGQRPVTVAQMRWSYPEDRQLTGDPLADNAKVEKVCGLSAVTASGGIALPGNVDYAVPTWSTADRPLRDGLPAFQADRGGLYFVSPPDIGIPPLEGTASGAGESTTTWTEATDANPAGSTKPVWVIPIGSEQQIFVNAVPTRVQIGNMQSRFAPEQLAANTAQAIAVSARQAELQLLTTLAGSSVQVKPQQYMGAARDLFASLDLLRAQYSDSHRIPRTSSFTAIFPAWGRDVIRADIARETAHDNSGPRDSMMVTDAEIDDLFSARNVNVIWTLDGLKAGTYGTGAGAITNQFFPTMTAAEIANSGAIHPVWPGQSGSGAFQLVWFLFVQGTYQYLDGGRLDLGVVRDSLLDASNDMEVFVEVFETVAFRGLESFQVQSTILPTGGSAGTVAATAYAE